MKQLLLLTLFFYNLCTASDTIEVSILTCAPGNEIYSVFGHSAIRIVDQNEAQDIVYNFGMFDFDTPNFTSKFIKGELLYRLGIQHTASFIQDYTLNNRTVTEQQLQLTGIEKIALAKKLKHLYQPENRYYLYSFLQKNCSTEIRDLLIELGVTFSFQKLDTSNRKLINSCLKENQWLRFGTGLLLGNTLDEKTDSFQSMFLPELLQKELNNATINGKKAVKSEHQLNSIEVKNTPKITDWITPFVIGVLLLLIMLFWHSKPFAFALFFSIGILGLFVLAVSLFSGHPEVKLNFNLLWCNPLYLIYIPLLLQNKTSKVVRYFLAAALLTAVFIWLLQIQNFDIGILPILIILGIANSKQLKKAYS